MTQPAAGKPTAGVLQIPAAATQKSISSAPTKKAPKPPTPRLKLLVRRLPPGLTQAEFEAALGEEWRVGAGKVDWLQYKPGKVSKDPAKPSRPSRAYLHVVSSEQVGPLSDQVRQASFQDARNTTHDPVLLGPPSLEFAPYAKTPGSRVRKDARQGTIDQDPDFIAFLESLTQPIAKPTTVDLLEPEEKKEAVVMTPLVQFIKDKKASKAKESGFSKSSKRAEKESKQEKVQAKKLLQRPDKESASGSASERKGKGEKTSKESSKASKQASGTTTTKSGKGSGTNTAKDTPSTMASERKRERGNVTAAAKILQRDLGLTTSGGRRRGKGGANDTGSPKNESPHESPGWRRFSITSLASSQHHVVAGDIQPPAKSSKNAKNKTAAASATPTATQAFLKHANPSQGVTEALLETAFAAFGAVTKVEIDKKKGFGYVDFAEPDGLQKAMAASPVSVAQSQVVVLERKANPGGEKSKKGGRGGDGASATGGKTKSGNSEGNGSGGGGGAGGSGGSGGSSRGPRGGRGRNKGPKGAGGGEGSKGGGAPATPTEKNGSEK
ncbi:hypothetical protein N7462_005254 [Penicillium macrosclerotiorum]|uniref:uncharacterized protein n=1 Tax=Penicillium macrosclerotiorum TaxID=303699 RepID=UPI0025467B0C|nr:uncharacterized protein N7462_005254 [Penicillium macrosclerotiorum]KAJ5690862.1 hypothetical protein N7462_005254 [Penicillium macrosclerotiorum]